MIPLALIASATLLGMTSIAAIAAVLCCRVLASYRLPDSFAFAIRLELPWHDDPDDDDGEDADPPLPDDVEKARQRDSQFPGEA